LHSKVYTIGYGGRSLEDFIRILEYYGVLRVVDVRRWNKSIKQPVFSGENLSRVLPKHGIEYYWIPELGGYRRFGVDVEDRGIATCFKSQGFRAYATFITVSTEAKRFLKKLVNLAATAPTVILCCEKHPWRCHRKIISDYLVAKGFKVLHILDAGKEVIHRLHRCAVVVGGELKYT